MQKHPNGISWDISFLLTKKTFFLTAFSAIAAGIAYRYYQEYMQQAMEDIASAPQSDDTSNHSTFDTEEEDRELPSSMKFASEPNEFPLDEKLTPQATLTEENLLSHDAQFPTKKPIITPTNTELDDTESAYETVSQKVATANVTSQKRSRGTTAVTEGARSRFVCAEAVSQKKSCGTTTGTDVAHSEFVCVEAASQKKSSDDAHSQFDFAETTSDKKSSRPESPARSASSLFKEQAKLVVPPQPKKGWLSGLNPWA